MRRTRTERRRRSVRVRRHEDDTRSPKDFLDPRDPDVVRAEQLRIDPARHP
ncbi:hypothetical protein [Streptomyces sp. 3213.3]|uniref:hypothetical protein n=1 Tax=Streptomyces sp. 3213.3 TaxID=1855348 RepID=UPI000AE898D7|nr:hypothetical protein [Streptomyces sp. 3213.3]